MGIEGNTQVLKCRDDHRPVFFEKDPHPPDEQLPFKLTKGWTCAWAKANESFGPAKLRERIEPWLTALFQSEHLSLLAGAGLSHAVHFIATGRPFSGMRPAQFTYCATEIETEAKRSAVAAGREAGNIEDQIRSASELLRGLEIMTVAKKELEATASGLQEDLRRVLSKFADSLLEAEHSLISAVPQQQEEAFNYLVSFLMSFASRTGTRDRLQIFTTNYDRVIEAGADLAGLHLLDRFVGALAPLFRSSRLDIDLHYNPPGIRGEPRYLEGVARLTKLHGSLDWVDCAKAIRRIALPFGAPEIGPYLSAPGLAGPDALRLMIYPNAAKDRETAAYPYVELFRDFAAAACRPNSTLVCYGYSFGDEHINRVVEDMLTIPSTHLVAISRSDPLGRIMQLYEKLGRHAQVTLLIGDHLGDLQVVVDNYLPKPAIDKTTFRMAELLKSRWAAGHLEAPGDETAGSADGGDNP